MIGETDFNKPTRQSIVAILLILYNVYKKVIKQFWILLIPFFVGNKSNSKNLIYGLIVLSIVLGIYSILDFLRYKFHIENTDLIIEKGVFSKKRIVIPFDRIQSINFKQNIIQQIFNVVGLEIDTAGTSKKEFDFHALNLNTSRNLRDFIFANRKQVKQTEVNTDISESQTYNILHLDISDLFKIGLTQNHFKSLGLAIFSLYWLANQLQQMGVNIDKYTKITEENVYRLGLYALIILSISAILLVIVVSVIRNMLRYYNLVLNRIPNGFKLDYGLFNRNEISVMDNKVQVLKWSDNVLRKLLGLFSLQLKLASSAVVKQKTSIIIPGIKSKDINNIISFYFSDNQLNHLNMYSVNKYYLVRRILIVSLVFSTITGLLFIFKAQIINDYKNWLTILVITFLVLIYFIFTSILKYKKTKYGFNEEVIKLNSGIFGNRHALYTIYKLQGVSITQSPAQIRRNLANLVIFSTSGNDKIIYIEKDLAEKLRDFILYRIETDKREWM